MKLNQPVNLLALACLAFCMTALSCTKSADESDNSSQVEPAYQLSYGDSIIYIHEDQHDYIVYPVQPRAGTYSGFPEGIDIDETTGAINVTQSETGLRYKITFTDTDGVVTETKVVLAGINFRDHFYFLSDNDSIAHPIYNALSTRILPVTGSSFDDDNGCNANGCAVAVTNGDIDLKQTIRNGIFGSRPQNDSRKDFKLEYKINDNSGKKKNKLKIRLYYYDSFADVPDDLLETLQDRSDQGVFVKNSRSGSTARVAVPRPPCIIIIAN